MTVHLTECGCPEYVERCAHYEGRAVWLISAASLEPYYLRVGIVRGKPCPGCGEEISAKSIPVYGVYGPGVVEEPYCCCSSGMTESLNKKRVEYWTPAGPVYRPRLYVRKSAALAAFSRAEAALLAGGIDA